MGVALLVLVTLAVGLVVFVGGGDDDLADALDDGTSASTTPVTTFPRPTTTTVPPPPPVPPGRVAVDGVGYRWTMSATPAEGNQPDPALPPGKVWIAFAGESVESVQVLYLDRDARLDLDAGLTGLANAFGGARTDVADAELAGQPARTAGFVGTAEDGPIIGRASVAVVGDRLLVVLVVRPSAEGEQLPAQFEALATSLAPL